MNKSKIYVGTIKRCLDSYSFDKFGDSRFVGDVNNPATKNDREIYAKVYKHDAILLKTRHEKYVDIEDIKGFMDVVLLKIGRSHKLLKTKPTKSDELFVESRSLRPYYNESENKGRLKYKVLKSH